LQSIRGDCHFEISFLGFTDKKQDFFAKKPSAS